MNKRQNITIIYLFVSIAIAFSFSMLLNVAIIPSLLPPVLFAGALAFSNEKYLLYKRPVTISITILGLLSVSIIEGILLWFWGFNDPQTVLLILKFIVLTVILLKTQNEIKVGFLQISFSIILISSQYLFFATKMNYFQANSRDIPEIANYVFMSLYCISLLQIHNGPTYPPIDTTIEEHKIADTRKGVSAIFKFIVVSLLTVFVIFLVFFIWVIASFGAFDTPKQDMITNFKKNERKLYEIKKYVEQIDPNRKAYEIEFNIHEQLGVFSITVNGQSVSEGYQDFNTFQAKDSLLIATGLTRQRLWVLKQKLDDVGCKSIERTDGYFSIGLDGNYRLYYNLLAPTVFSALFKDPCRYIIYSPAVVFEYKYEDEHMSDICFPDK